MHFMEASHSSVPNNPSKIFYGYIIVLASFFIVLIMHGMQNTYGILFHYLQAEFGWSRVMISGAHSLVSFLMGLFSIASGRLTDRFGPRVPVTICGLILGLGYLLMSQLNTVWLLYLFYGVMVGIGLSCGDVPLLSTTARWFVRRRGTMSGILKVGTGTGILVMPLVASWLILSFGWRQSYLILGIASLAAIMLIAQLLRRDPSKKGLRPYGVYNADDGDFMGGGLTFHAAVRTRQFWVLCAAYFLLSYCAMAIMVHIAPHATDLGISTAHAAGLLSTVGGISILGRLAMGYAGDRVGNRQALIINFLILVAALFWLQFANWLWALYLFAVIYGFAHGGFFALMSPLVAELFGTKSHGVIFGMFWFIVQTGAAIGPVVTGWIFDATLSYQLAFLIFAACGVLGLILSTSLRPVTAGIEE